MMTESGSPRIPNNFIMTVWTEILCGLLNESDPEAARAFMVPEVMQRHNVDAETAWAWLDGREAPGGARQETRELMQACPRCQHTMSNLTGIYLVGKKDQQLEVCTLCKEVLMSEGWYLVAQQR